MEYQNNETVTMTLQRYEEIMAKSNENKIKAEKMEELFRTMTRKMSGSGLPDETIRAIYNGEYECDDVGHAETLDSSLNPQKIVFIRFKIKKGR